MVGEWKSSDTLLKIFGLAGSCSERIETKKTNVVLQIQIARRGRFFFESPSTILLYVYVQCILYYNYSVLYEVYYMRAV